MNIRIEPSAIDYQKTHHAINVMRSNALLERLIRFHGDGTEPVIEWKAPETKVETQEQKIEPLRREYETTKRPSPYQSVSQRIMSAVALEFGISLSDLKGKSQKQNLCYARFVTIGLLIEMTNLSLPSIARRLGGRDHTTIIHGRHKARDLFASEAFRNRVDQIKAEIAR